MAARGDRLSLLRMEARISISGGAIALHDEPEDHDPAAELSKPAVSAFESYEYQGYGSQLRFEAEASEAAQIDLDKLVQLLLQSIVPLVLGVSVGTLAWLSNGAAVGLIRLKWSMVLSLVNAGSDGLKGIVGIAAAYPVLAIYCMLLTAGAAALTVYVAPSAAGSGIPMVKAELNGGACQMQASPPPPSR